MQYRREIDGLRAIAVLPVIFFHAGVSAFSGGFVGVDVFFVISGYLITSIILGDLESAEGFSIARFYERRARRILPALYLVMFFSSIAAWFLMLPDQLENYGQSLVATTLFSNNLLLAYTTGYWDIMIELKPLVHTWSLSVEEQFYVVFPLIMIGMWKRPKGQIVWLLGGLAVASLAAAEWGTQNLHSGHYYLPHSRAWELLVGAFCAFALDRRDPVRNNFGALLGIAMIGYAIFAFDENTPFPSCWGLIPVVGTALIILFATEDSWFGRMLSWRPFVGIGLISYSAYLWHQPIFAFARAYLKDKPDPFTLSLMTPAILFIAYFSWRYVEAPFRDRRRVGMKGLIWFAAPVSLAFVIVGAAFHLSHGAPGRISSEGVGGDRSSDYNTTAFSFKRDTFVTQKPVKLLVIGDSFGRDAVNMIKETFGTDHIEIVYRDDMQDCLANTQVGSVFANLLMQSDTIIVSRRENFDANCLGSSIAWAAEHGKTYFVFGTKSFGTNINWIMQVPTGKRALLHNMPDPDLMRTAERMKRTVPAANYIDLMDHIMNGDRVPFTDEAGSLLSDDTRHLTRAGAIYVGKRALNDLRIRSALEANGR